MTCQHIQTQIEAYIDGMLGASESDSVADHLAHCLVCEEHYNHQKTFLFKLSQVSIQRPPAGYKKRAFAHAREMHEGYNSGFKHGALATTAAAITLMFIISWIVFPDKPIQTMQSAQLEQMKMSFNETRVMHLVFDSPVNIDQATIALNLPADITLVDIPELNIPGSRTVTWNINIKNGKNRLRL